MYMHVSCMASVLWVLWYGCYAPTTNLRWLQWMQDQLTYHDMLGGRAHCEAAQSPTALKGTK